MIIHLVCAARPNFMKIAPLYHALKRESWTHPIIVHTGQHYDYNMSDTFFSDLGLPEPDIHLGVKSVTHAEQAGHVMIAYEKILVDKRPDIVIVVGDVNSTMATTLAASKLGVKVAHLEAGLRSYDRTMPEEINRLVTDVLADILLTPSEDAVDNLIAEGIPVDRIHFVGNIMIDSLEMLRDKIEREKIYKTLGLEARGYGVVTMHRPSNVDNVDTLAALCSILREISNTVPLIFPIHPRTRKRMEENHLLSILERAERIIMPQPMGYIHFMNLVMNSQFVITDSGGIQEETSYLGIPCITVRKNTERPITITQGTNQLCELEDVRQETEKIITSSRHIQQKKIKFWDGRTAERITDLLRGMRSNKENGHPHPLEQGVVT